MSDRPVNNIKASNVLTAPRASGRFFVRSTNGSNFRSAKSFITQPADLIVNTPSRKIIIIFACG